MVHYNARNSYGWLDTLAPEQLARIEVVAGDICDYFSVENAMKGAEYVFHLAALIGIPYSYVAPDRYVAVNIQGTLNVLQAARNLSPARILVVSTSEVYGSAQFTPITEAHPLQGQSPYSATKIGAEKMAEAFWRSFGLPVSIVRPFNTYGPRQSARAVIPAIVAQLLGGSTDLALGDLSPTRDFVFVRDTVRGMEAILRSPHTIGQTLNLATGIETSIGDVAQLLVQQLAPTARITQETARMRPADSEVMRLLGANTQLCALTDWQPQTPLADGLAQTIAWFRQHPIVKTGYTV
jgi:NAD dependent epimerase/dehydratase